MSYLFIDSTYDLSIGILDDGLKWLSFENHKGQKASTIIQAKTYELLSKHQIEPENLKAIISVNGPGFYTGLRLAEGFADVLKFFGVLHYSFYSYEIPYWCGHEAGHWFTKAYRGEYFLYSWDGNSSSHKLLSSKEIPEVLEKLDSVFIHSDVSLDELSRKFLKETRLTTDLLEEKSEIIFRKVLDTKSIKEAFYFRAPEDEFKANP